jgi:hypothetical protein
MLKPRFTYIKFRQEPLNPNNYVLVTGPDEAEIQTMCSLYRAAPDLLAGMEELLEALRKCINNGFEGHHFDRFALADGQARAVIAKATTTL